MTTPLSGSGLDPGLPFLPLVGRSGLCRQISCFWNPAADEPRATDGGDFHCILPSRMSASLSSLFLGAPNQDIGSTGY